MTWRWTFALRPPGYGGLIQYPEFYRIVYLPELPEQLFVVLRIHIGYGVADTALGHQELGDDVDAILGKDLVRSEEHTSELQSLMRISYAVFCLKNKTQNINTTQPT